MRTRIELSGRVLRTPELRAMPNGTSVLRLAVDCGEAGERLTLELVVIGAAARELAGLRVGQEVQAQGRLRAVGRPLASAPARQQLEVVVTHLAAVTDAESSSGLREQSLRRSPGKGVIKGLENGR